MPISEVNTIYVYLDIEVIFQNTSVVKYKEELHYYVIIFDIMRMKNILNNIYNMGVTSNYI